MYECLTYTYRIYLYTYILYCIHVSEYTSILYTYMHTNFFCIHQYISI